MMCKINAVFVGIYVPEVVPMVCKGHNGHFQAPKTEENTPESACKRITTACKLLQSILADKLREFKLKPKTFTLESNCHIFYSNLDAASTYKMTQIDLWYYFAREIMSSDIGHSNRKYIAFLSCTVYEGTDYFDDMSYEEVLDLVKGYVAYGGDGLALLSTACLYTWPETQTEIYARFNDFELVDRTQFMDDSCYRGTLSGCFATTLGAALHELCHTFNLGHTETGIMGCDFGNTQNIFLANTQLQRFSRLRYRNDLLKSNGDYMELLNSSLAILYYHKWFNPYSKQARKCTFKYDSANKVVRSTAGIRVIEIRREIDSMVLKSWTFVDKVLKFSFSVFEDVKNLENSIILYVVDDGGNIFTEPICS
ncbi:hypothetical protein FQA39_LY16551 [Lamprigera yunnana]|nr:hypothetical protein FQA39_LY16551 [Lamprigera yunnana]